MSIRLAHLAVIAAAAAILLSSPPLEARSKPSSQVLLEAHAYDQQAWTLTLTHQSPGRCTVRLSGPAVGKARHKALPPAQCQNLLALAHDASSDPASAQPIEPAIQFDEPSYKLKLGSRSLAVLLRAPEECVARASGDLACEKVALTAAQKLLIPLREQAQEMLK
jgi:hypothetical protein